MQQITNYNAGEEVKIYYCSRRKQLKNGSRTAESLKSNGCYEGGIINCVEDKLSGHNDLT